MPHSALVLPHLEKCQYWRQQARRERENQLSSEGAAFAPFAAALLEAVRFGAKTISAVIARSVAGAVPTVSDSAMLSVIEL